MSISRAILRDITDLKLDPRVPHSVISANGRLKKQSMSEDVIEVSQSSEDVLQPDVDEVSQLSEDVSQIENLEQEKSVEKKPSKKKGKKQHDKDVS